MNPKEKSMGLNAILYASRTVLSIIFPLVTYPYAARVLEVENMGAVQYTASIVSYFLLVAELGITTYAMREGAQYRDNKKELEKFSSEVFSIGLVSSISATFVLAFCILFIPLFKTYTALFLVQGVSVLGNCLAINWLYTIKEDFGYIALRSLVVHIVALVLMFIFVRTRDDYVIYAATTVVANTGANVFNYFNARKYCRIQIRRFKEWKHHLKSICIIFGSSVTATIYGNSDKTMLGVMAGNYSVGLYGTSVNVYSALKGCISAVALSTLSRLSFYKNSGNIVEYEKTANRILSAILILLLPVVTGVFCISDEIILLIGGRSYIEASLSLKILSIGMFFSLMAIFYTSVVLLPNHQELIIMKGSIVSAVLNVILNLLLLTQFKQNGAAFTTLLAEMYMFSYEAYKSRKLINLKPDRRLILSAVLGCVVIVIMTLVISRLNLSFVLGLLAKIMLSGLIYAAIVVTIGKVKPKDILRLKS